MVVRRPLFRPDEKAADHRSGSPALARLSSLAAAVILGFGAPAHGQVDRWSTEISEAAARFEIPKEWIRRVMKAESDGQTELGGEPIISRAGAMGLMQLMPGTWQEMRAANGLGRNPFDPHDNIIAGAAYLREMYQRFGYPGLFAAYNAGPSRYFRHVTSCSRLPRETMNYLRKTSRSPLESQLAFLPPCPSKRAVAAVFAVRAADEVATETGAAASLFAIRH